MALPERFDAEVQALVREVPAGRVITYGRIAQLLGMPGYARHVGRALSEASDDTPCHRVVNACGRPAPGWTEQRTLLEAEGVRFKANGRVDLAASEWELLRSDTWPEE